MAPAIMGVAITGAAIMGAAITGMAIMGTAITGAAIMGAAIADHCSPVGNLTASTVEKLPRTCRS